MKQNSLKYSDIFFVVFGNILGVGAFLTPYYISAQLNGPLEYIFVWVFASIGALAGGSVYASLAYRFRQNGGDFVFLSRFWGEKWAQAFFISMFLFAFPGSVAILASGASLYIVKLAELMNANIPLHQNLLAVLFILLFLLMNLNKMKTAVLNQRTLVIFLFILLILIFSVIVSRLSWESLPFQEDTKGTGHIFRAVLFSYFSFIGFASVAYIAGDIEKKEKNFSKPVIMAVAGISLIYLLLNTGYVLGIPWTKLQSESASIFALVEGRDFRISASIYLLLVLASLSSLNVLFLTGGRLFEFIYSGFMKEVNLKKSLSIFNLSLFIMAFFGVIFLLTQTFGEILNTTTWVILSFSFLTSMGFLKELLLKRMRASRTEWIAVIVFTLFSLIITVTGIYEFMQQFLKGVLYIIAGFLVFYVLLFKKKTRKTDAEAEG